MIDMIEPVLRWLVAPLVAVVWFLFNRTNKNTTDVAVLNAKLEAQSRNFDEMRDTIKAIFKKLDSIEQSLRK